jgi:hypothetical protein
MARDRLQELERYVTEYADLQYPDDDTRSALTERELQDRGDSARGRACVIADLVIQYGLHRVGVDADGRVHDFELARTLASYEDGEREIANYDYEAQWDTGDDDADGI